MRINIMKAFVFTTISAAVVSALMACVPATLPATTPTHPTDAPISAATAQVRQTMPNTGQPIPTISVSMSKTPPANADEAATQLVQALELALNEMRAAQNNSEIAYAQTRAQSSLNILVGRYGRWYSTQVSDPSNKLGVLPGETPPQGGGADGDRPPPPTAGLALLTMGTSTTPSPELVAILGDVKLWQSTPRAGYDASANAVNTADTAQLQLGNLQGSVPRAVAWQRLVLTQAVTSDDARAFSAQALAELETALSAARAIARQ